MTRLRKMLLLYLIAILALVLTYLLIYRRTTLDFKNIPYLKTSLDHSSKPSRIDVSITVVACGSKLEETLTMLKSALIYNTIKTFLNIKIITEDVLKQKFESQLIKWQKDFPNHFSFELYSLQFPKTGEKDWRNLFKPCAAQRLFLPSLLRNTDATLYVDTDIVFLSSVEDIWSHFNNFNASQIAGLSPEHEDTQIGWYNRFARHPFYGPLGVNSGVMLMNLTRMRLFDWENQILPLYKKYRSQITWGDQDLINILFFYHPDKLYIFPCIFNYRPDHCMYVNVCNITEGIRILHGNRGYFHLSKQPIFKKIYETIRDLNVTIQQNYNNSLSHFPYQLNYSLVTSLANSSMCFKIINKIGKQHIPALT
ncbi:glucoside xylosyltransferase 2 [Episyrphus balteatus]|uniref:glucoside xylosyltransferase 2 n=1 Tax=Episyrphus balteatus TaxID=286459 RepID=UPI00248503B5|nr:glucoside xylosyltransferase 2 [Episyrphus balteatus]